MGKFPDSCLVFATAPLWLGISVPALAQDRAAADEGAATTADDIIVTARRSDERLQDVPISISVFSQQQLSNRNIVSAVDLATYTPSLSVNTRYGPEKANFAIRGFTQDTGTAPSVAVYFAEAPALRLNSAVNGGNGAGVGSMFDLQNVQVLKGPQGTLFGRNTTGGAILLVPQRPTDRFEGYIEGTIGDYNARRVESVINIPLSDTFKVRLGADINKRDGYLNNRSGVGPTDFANVSYQAFRLSILGELTPNLENYILATYANSNTNGPVGKIAVCNQQAIGGSREGAVAGNRLANCAQLTAERAAGYGYYDVQNTVSNPFIKIQNWQVIDMLTYRANDSLTIKNIASYGESREAYSFNLFGDNVPFPFATPYPGILGPQGYQNTFTEELQFQGKVGSQLDWQAGGYLERSDPVGAGQEQYNVSLARCTNVYAFQCTPLTSGASTTGTISVQRNNFYFRSKALYAQATYRFSDQWAITAGVRNTWDSARGTGNGVATGNGLAPPPTSTGNAAAISPAGLTGTNLMLRCSQATTPTDVATRVALLTSPNGCFRDFRQSSSKPTWTIDLEYKPTEDIMGYIKYARGYRPGGVNQSTLGSEVWQPEKVNLYEVGLKLAWRGNVGGSFNIAGFYNDFTNQQVNLSINQCSRTASPLTCTNPAPSGVSGIQNVGKSRIKGVEIDATLRFFDDILRIDAGYAYLDAKAISTTIPPCNIAVYDCPNVNYLQPGETLYLTPKNRATLTGTLTLPVDQRVGRISASATLTHTDSSAMNHTDDNAFRIGAIPFNPSRIPGTDLLNLNLNWASVASLPVDLALFATNVTNVKYYNASTNGLSNTGADFILIAPPRMYGARLKLRFGH